MNVYHRLNELIRYMCDEDFPATIPNIANAMGIYEQQVKLDIDYLQNYEAPKGHPLFKENIKISSIDGEPCYHLTTPAFTTYTDPAKLYDTDERPSTNSKILPLTVLEHTLYNFGLNQTFEISSLEEYYDSDIPLTVLSNKKMCNINKTHIILTVDKAIRLGESIRITITGKTQLMTPHFIKQDIDTGSLYVIEVDEDGYITCLPLHKIDYCEIIHIEEYPGGDKIITSKGINSENIDYNTAKKDTINPNKTIISPKTTAHLDCIWSFHPDALAQIEDEEPVHVKLKIFEDNPNIINKIKKDTHCRARGTLYGPITNSPKSQDTPNIYYYEDDVLGIESFKYWVRQFGSSAIVLEPKTLAYDIYRELI